MNTRSRAIAPPIAKWSLLAGLILLLAWAPLPLGSNRAWSVGLLAIIMGALMPLAAWAFWGELARYLRLIQWPMTAFAAVFVYIQVQAFFRIGDLDALLEAELGLAVGACAFLIGFLLAAAHSRFAYTLLASVTAIGAAYALYGLMEVHYTDSDILWFDHLLLEGVADSTFVNRNTFATYAGCCFVTALALLLNIPGMKSPGHLRAALIETNSRTQDVNAILLIVCAILIILAGLLLTQSRGGIIATGLAAAAYVALWVDWNNLRWRNAVVPSIVSVGVLTIILLTFGGAFLQRLGADGLLDTGRGPLWVATLHMISDRPFTGQGFGSWETIFPAFRPEDMRPFPDFDKAHNGYLEIIATLGIPFGLLFLSIFGWVVLRFVRGYRQRRKNHLYARLGIALCLIAGLHSLFDYSLQIPAMGVSFAAIIGACIAQSFPRSARMPNGLPR